MCTVCYFTLQSILPQNDLVSQGGEWTKKLPKVLQDAKHLFYHQGGVLQSHALCHRNLSNPKGLVCGFLNQFLSFTTKIRGLIYLVKLH